MSSQSDLRAHGTIHEVPGLIGLLGRNTCMEGTREVTAGSEESSVWRFKRWFFSAMAAAVHPAAGARAMSPPRSNSPLMETRLGVCVCVCVCVLRARARA